MENKKNGFTLIELFGVIVAVVVILSVVYQIINKPQEISKDNLESIVKNIAEIVENQYAVAQVLNKEFASTGSCGQDIPGLNDTDYESCTYQIISDGTAKITLVGKSRFKGLKVVNGTRSIATAVEEESWFGNFFVSLILTIFCYMVYPFVSVKIVGKKYNVESCKKMALWNSVIVGGVFMIMTVSSGGAWNVFPAYLYYTINKSLWVSKEKKVSKTKKNIKTKSSSTKQKITVCKCGCKVLEQFDKCPKCGRKVSR